MFKLRYRITSLLHILLNIGPILVFVIMAYIDGDLLVEKVSLSLTVFIVAIMTLLTFVNHKVYKSRIWIILLGLYACLDYMLAPLLTIAICQVIDEMVIDPLRGYYRERYVIHKEINRV